MPYKNKEKAREASKKWRLKNPEYMKEWRKANPDYHKNYSRTSSRPSSVSEVSKERKRQYARDFRKRNPGYRNKYKESHQRYIDNNRDKIYARHTVYKALKRGKLTKPDTCEDCGSGGTIEADHHDYKKRLDVRWLCQDCHRAVTLQRNQGMI